MNTNRTVNAKSGVLKAGAVQWIAFAVLLAAMFSASKRAAIPAIMAIVKFTWPVLVIWLVWRVIKAKIMGGVQRFQQQVMDAAQQGGMNAGAGAQRFRNANRGGDVLDLCGKCGTLLQPGHICAN